MNNWPIYPQKDEQTEKMQATKKIVPLMFLFILTIGSYYISAQIGSFLTIPGTNIGYIWPPVGIALALMLLFGYRIWPAIAIAAVITDLPFLVSHFPLKTALFMAFGQTLADVLEIVLSVFLLTKISKDQQFFNRASAVLKFVLAVCISQFISAIINIASLYLGEKILYSNFGEILWSYWVSNVVSILLLTPLILIWVRNRKSSSKFRVAYHTIFYLLTIAATLLIFSLHIPGRNDYFEYFTFLFVICAAFVLGQTGVTMVVALVATITLWTTSTGSGPFIYATSDDSLLILEIYLATLSISGLVV
jgi:integral membrane sensor domain MASE1